MSTKQGKLIKFSASFLALIMIFSLAPLNVFNVSAAEAEQVQLTIDSASAMPGETVELNVVLSNTVAVKSMSASNITYDTSKLTLSKVEWLCDAEIKNWNSVQGRGVLAFSDNTPVQGPVLKMTFAVNNPSADAIVAVTLNMTVMKMNEANDEIPLDVVITPGSVNIFNAIRGDFDGNEKKNSNDAVYLLYHVMFGNEDYPINQSGDMDGNGKVNSNDAVYLLYNVMFGDDEYPLESLCSHELVKVEASPATCTEDGNIAYWHCTKCGKYFSDAAGVNEITLENTVIKAAHTLTHFDYKAPTYTESGNNEYWKCSVCGKYFSNESATVETTWENIYIPPLEPNEHTITYDIANGDPYIENLISTNAVSNNPRNPDRFDVEVGVSALYGVTVPGYQFQGWFDSAGDQVRSIAANTDHDIELYAHWTRIQYTVQYRSDIAIDRVRDTYYVNEGLSLLQPRLSNYVFVGWLDESGNLITNGSLPIGTTGNMILTAQWTSERNKTWTKRQLDAPIIYEDEENNMLLFIYEIGEIQNIPLYTIKDFGYISGDGVTKTETETYSTTTSETLMQALSSTVANATTKSSNWTLSSSWNESTEIDEEWARENDITVENIDSRCKSETGNWNISNSTNGSSSSTSTSTNQNNWQSEVKVNNSYEQTDTTKTAAKVGSKIGAEGFGVKAEISAEISAEDSSSSTSKSGLETGNSHGTTNINTSSSTSTAGWSSSSSYGGSSTVADTLTTSTAVAEKICESTGKKLSYVNGGNQGQSDGVSATNSQSEEYSTTVTYSTVVATSKTTTWTTQATKPGYHRWVVAGNASVFAIVGYDIATGSFSVNTYVIMNEETHEFEDYSNTTSNYNDHENGVITFEVPGEVRDYVSDYVSVSEGLRVNQEGEVTSYNGTDNCVVIPEYYNIGGGEVIKVTGIAPGAFMNNTNIVAVVLSDFIEEIPADAFNGCTNLEGVIGGSITSIGDRAFYGCTSIVDIAVTPKINHVGQNAFYGVHRVLVNPLNGSVAVAAAASGADNIVMYLNNLDVGAQSMSGKTLVVPSTTDYFELNGYSQTFTNFVINSSASTTVLNNVKINNPDETPLVIDSAEVILNKVELNSGCIALVLKSAQTHLGVQGNVTVTSENAYSMLCKNVSLYESNQNMDGRLIVSGKILVCGTIDAQGLMSYGSMKNITAQEYESLLARHSVTFNANGGTLSSTSGKTLYYGQSYGTLPVPEREYYIFDGWFTAATGGTQITASSIFELTSDVTLYAHWTLNSFIITFNANGGTVNPSSLRAYCGQTLGTLPVPVRDYCNFLGWYTAVEGGNKITASTSISAAQDITLYAHWELKPLSDWTLASNVPSGAQIVNEEWRYTRTQNMESMNASESGWTQIGSRWEQTATGSTLYATFPSTFKQTHEIYTSFAKAPFESYENTNTKREVTNTFAGYVYWHWAYNAVYANNTSRWISDRKQTAGSSRDLPDYAYNYFFAFTSTTNASTISGFTYTWGANAKYDSSAVTYNCSGCLPSGADTSNTSGLNNPRFLRFNYYTSTYTDYQKIYQHQKVTSETSSVAVSNGGEISNVQKYVKYREK